MTPRLRRIVPLVAAALLLALPVDAQDVGPRVSYAGVGFELAPSLGRSIAIVPVAGQAPDAASVVTPRPAHTSFAISNVTQDRKAIPGAYRAPGTVNVHATADIPPYPWANDQLTQLQALLTDRPELATFEAPDALTLPLPYLGGGDAAQLVRSRAHYIDTPQLSGVAYVAAFGQDIYRFGEDDFWYIFQGLSADGSRYVEMTWVLTAPGFPKRSSIKEKDTKGDTYERYLERVIGRLNAADPTAFRPQIAALDALVASITFEGVPAVEPSPLASPEASVAPSASPGA